MYMSILKIASRFRASPYLIGGLISGVLLTGCDTRGGSPGWQEFESMSSPRSEIQAAYLDGSVFVAGGIGYYRTSEICEFFHIDTGTWARCPDLPKNLHHVAMAADNELVYAGGGYTAITFADQLSFSYDETPKLWALRPGDASWEEIVDLPEPIAEHNFVDLGETLFLLGGETPIGTSNKVWAFDKTSKTWTEKAPMPTARYSAATVILEDEIWVLGGRSRSLGPHIDSVEVYSPSTDTWRTAPAMPDGRAGHAAAVWQGRIHVFGGEMLDPVKLLERHQIFDPKLSSWSDGKLPPKPRHGWAAVTTPNGVFVIGGGAKPAYDTLYSVTGTTQFWNGH